MIVSKCGFLVKKLIDPARVISCCAKSRNLELAYRYVVASTRFFRRLVFVTLCASPFVYILCRVPPLQFESFWNYVKETLLDSLERRYYGLRKTYFLNMFGDALCPTSSDFCLIFSSSFSFLAVTRLEAEDQSSVLAVQF